jgi:hypothetical protein
MEDVVIVGHNSVIVLRYLRFDETKTGLTGPRDGPMEKGQIQCRLQGLKRPSLSQRCL